MTATVITSAQDLDIHSFDNTELKEKFEINSCSDVGANMLCDWIRDADKYLKRIKNTKKKYDFFLSVGFRK